MKIIIPMTGYGSRFVNAGYRTLKPFIEVEGIPIIEWIVRKVFPGEEDFLFICRKEHLDTLPYVEKILREIAPHGQIFAVEDWRKQGPVCDVLRASEAICDKEPVIVNYCDFYMSWDWPKMKARILNRGCDGCVPCYTGFHPHLIPKNNLYASCRTDENDNLLEIREKYSFEANKFQGKHSPGTYYFRTGRLLKKYFQKLVDAGVSIGGEYYASLPFQFMVKDGLKVWIPTEIMYFCQWGTPEDMEESLYWLSIMRSMKEI